MSKSHRLHELLGASHDGPASEHAEALNTRYPGQRAPSYTASFEELWEAKRRHMRRRIIFYGLAAILVPMLIFISFGARGTAQTAPPQIVERTLGFSLGTTPLPAGRQLLTIQSDQTLYRLGINLAEPIPLDTELLLLCHGEERYMRMRGDQKHYRILPDIGDAQHICTAPQ